MSAIRSWVAFSDLAENATRFTPAVMMSVVGWHVCEKVLRPNLWICRNQNALPLEWDTDFLKQQVDGFEKITRTKSDDTYIDWNLARKVVAYSNSRDRHEQACLYAVAASMMPRVQNELLPLRWNDFRTHSRVNIDQKQK